ncbi:hypothetical protein OIU84_010609 [Salix udensis]|uniref:Reverse transcriptase n=1 Tax=Salix udensis TaxID=889485 RepID=A0AAD6JN34_9ROSI|nr:hypothetical protein OIU84_010609 [Salix udensis]
MRATTQARSVSDHNPIIVSLAPPPPHRKARFKVLNTWVSQEGYEELVREAWHTEAYGNPMSRLASRLRTLKWMLTAFHRRHSSNIGSRFKKVREQWEEAQVVLDTRPNDMTTNTNEREACYAYNRLCAVEEAIYRQRSRIQWLQLGDKNTAFFHRSLIHRNSRNMIASLQRESGEVQ